MSDQGRAVDQIAAAAAEITSSAPAIGETLDRVNQAVVANQVRAGKLPASVLDHIGHKQHGIRSSSCEWCEEGR
jgi:hypothetical protein